MTLDQLYQAQLAQAKQCIDMLVIIAMGIDTNEPDKYDCLGAVHDFQAGLDRLKNPKPETLTNSSANI